MKYMTPFLFGVLGAASLMTLFALVPKANFIARIPPIGGRATTLRAA